MTPLSTLKADDLLYGFGSDLFVSTSVYFVVSPLYLTVVIMMRLTVVTMIHIIIAIITNIVIGIYPYDGSFNVVVCVVLSQSIQAT